MRLSGTQFNNFRDALFLAFDHITLDEMLRTWLDFRYDSIVSPRAGMEEILPKVIRYFDIRGHTPDLLRAALKANPDSPTLKDFVARHPEYDPTKSQSLMGDYYESRILVGHHPFFNRQQLRSRLKQIGTGINSRTLVITGERGSGKTYSYQFINYVLAHEPADRPERPRIRVINLDDSFEPVTWGPSELAAAIGAELDLDITRMPNRISGETVTRWNDRLIQKWIVRGIENQPCEKIWWLVFDGFAVRELPEDTRDLLEKFINQVDSSAQLQERLRIVLLGYTRLPEWLDFTVLKEEITKVGLADLEDFLDHLYRLCGIEASRERLTQDAQQVMMQVEARLQASGYGEERRLEYLHLAFGRLVQRLLHGDAA